MRKNTDVRLLLVQHGVHQWQVAKAIGITEASLSRLMRDELSAERKGKIINAIQNLSQRGVEDNGN